MRNIGIVVPGPFTTSTFISQTACRLSFSGGARTEIIVENTVKKCLSPEGVTLFRHEFTDTSDNFTRFSVVFTRMTIAHALRLGAKVNFELIIQKQQAYFWVL